MGSIIYDNLPDLGSPGGFFFYAGVLVFLVKFIMWLIVD